MPDRYAPLWMNRPCSSGKAASSRRAIMRRWTSCARPRPKGRPGWPSWKPGSGKAPGIKNLKIKYNKVFGYYLEVTNSYKELVPEYYHPQADAGQCGALHHPGTKGAGGYDSGRRGQAVFPGIRAVLPGAGRHWRKRCCASRQTARAIAGMDVFASLSLVAERNNYVQPEDQ